MPPSEVIPVFDGFNIDVRETKCFDILLHRFHGLTGDGRWKDPYQPPRLQQSCCEHSSQDKDILMQQLSSQTSGSGAFSCKQRSHWVIVSTNINGSFLASEALHHHVCGCCTTSWWCVACRAGGGKHSAARPAHDQGGVPCGMYSVPQSQRQCACTRPDPGNTCSDELNSVDTG